MKRLFISMALSISCILSWAQGPDIQWQTCLVQYFFSNTTSSIEQTPDSGYIVAGSTAYSNNVPNLAKLNFSVTKITKTGAAEWQKLYGGNNDDEAFAVTRTTDGGYIVAGFTFSTPVNPPFSGDVTLAHGGKDAWVIKLSSTGVKQWQRSYGGSEHDEFQDIQQTTDGGYIAIGYTGSHDGYVLNNMTPITRTSYWIVKINSSGAIEWQKAIGGRYGMSIRQTTDGGYIASGTASATDMNVTGNHGSFDYWVVKLTATGDITWQKSLGGAHTDNGAAVRQTPDGGYITTGTSTIASGNYFLWSVKLDSNGNTAWAKNLGGGASHGNSLEVVPGGGYVFAGYSSTDEGNHGAADFYVVKTDTAGNIEWNKSMGGSNSEYIHYVKPTFDGGFILAGETYSHNGDVTGASSATYTTWVVKLAGGFCPVSTWTGAAGTSAWEDPLNWNCGIPTSGTRVIINSGNVVISSNVTVYSLSATFPANITVASTGNLAILH